MIISKEFYDRRDPSYRKIIDELEKKIEDIENHQEKFYDKDEEMESILTRFYTTHYLPLEYFIKYFFDILMWDDYKEFIKIWYPEAYMYFRNHKEREECFKKSLNDYLYVFDYDKSNIYVDYTTNRAHEKDFDHPHSHLQQFFQHFEKHLSSPPSKEQFKKYEEMKSLYLKIKAAEDNVEEWFTLLLEVGIENFVIQTVEYRIGTNLHDANIWKLYIGYLKEVDRDRLFLWYSKYCRFFLDDLEMKEKYKIEMQEYRKPIKLPWSNLFDFEMDFCVDKNVLSEDDEEDYDMKSYDSEAKESSQNDEEMEEDDNYESDDSDPQVSPIQILASKFYETAKNQKFSLPKPIMDYILKNANEYVLRKLFSSCKYFFAKKLTPICYSLQSNYDETIYDDEMLLLALRDFKNKVPKNAYITTTIYLAWYLPSDFMSKEICLRLSKCDAKYIEIFNQHLTFEELKFFIGHGNVVELCLFDCIIKDADDSFIDLENIMVYLPNIEQLKLSSIKFNANTMKALANLKFNSKIRELCLFDIKGKQFDPLEFQKYCIANRAGTFRLVLRFDRLNFAEKFVNEISKVINDYGESCKNTTVRIDFYDNI